MGGEKLRRLGVWEVELLKTSRRTIDWQQGKLFSAKLSAWLLGATRHEKINNENNENNESNENNENNENNKNNNSMSFIKSFEKTSSSQPSALHGQIDFFAAADRSAGPYTLSGISSSSIILPSLISLDVMLRSQSTAEPMSLPTPNPSATSTTRRSSSQSS